MKMLVMQPNCSVRTEEEVTFQTLIAILFTWNNYDWEYLGRSRADFMLAVADT